MSTSEVLALRQLVKRLAEQVADSDRRLKALERPAAQRYRSIEGGTQRVYDDAGAVRVELGVQEDGSVTYRDVNAPPPVTPALPTVEERPGVLVVSYAGATSDGSAWLSDFARVEVHVSTTSGFVPNDVTQVAEFTTSKGGSVTLALDPVEHYVVLVAANRSGTESDPTAEVAATPQAPATGSGGITTYHEASEPLGLGADDDGSLWYDTANGNRLSRWDGTLLDWILVLVDTQAIAAEAITANELAALAVEAGKIAASAVDSAELADGAVVAAKIQAGAVEAGKIAAGAVEAGNVAAGAIQAGNLAAGAVQAGNIEAGSVDTNELAAGAVTADRLDAEAVNGKTITGGVFLTDDPAAPDSDYQIRIASSGGSPSYGEIQFDNGDPTVKGGRIYSQAASGGGGHLWLEAPYVGDKAPRIRLTETGSDPATAVSSVAAEADEVNVLSGPGGTGADRGELLLGQNGLGAVDLLSRDSGSVARAELELRQAGTADLVTRTATGATKTRALLDQTQVSVSAPNASGTAVERVRIDNDETLLYSPNQNNYLWVKDNGVFVRGPFGDDTGDLVPTSPFTGALRFIKIGNLVFMSGYVDRDDDFGTGRVSLGMTIPTNMRPAGSTYLTPPAVGYNSSAQYRYAVNTDGTVEIQRTAVITTFMGVSAFWTVPVA